jgi:hypothetical protein
LPPEAMLETIEELLEETGPLGGYHSQVNFSDAAPGSAGVVEDLRGPSAVALHRSPRGRGSTSPDKEVAEGQGRTQGDRTEPLHWSGRGLVGGLAVDEPPQPQISS